MTAATVTRFRSRRRLTVRGLVQGVGFRPAVYRAAVELGLAGYVRNDPDGVTIEVEGDDDTLDAFCSLLPRHAPSAARIDAIGVREVPPSGATAFEVAASSLQHGNDRAAEAPADRATCDDCVREMFDPHDRRYRYPFITCTNCGPRYTIIRALPYDRSRTTMAAFTMCAACRGEYDDPRDRRFHAETNACAACGPKLAFLGRDRRSDRPNDRPIEAAIAAIRAGATVAVKGLGGFHLAADASCESAVTRLRERKRRPAKPFAVMVRDLSVASRLAFVSGAAKAALLHPARPVVCLPSRHALAPSVAPRLNEIGIMLPYTPLHHLLFDGGPEALVMTSGNEADEPIAIDDREALERLGGIADAFLTHDRAIHARADDSVVRIVCGEAQPVRRSRGYVPESIAFPFEAPPLLATGAELKNTICIAKGRAAVLSPHIGDLSNPVAFSFFEELARAAAPAVIAHDLHPDYRSTRWAMSVSEAAETAPAREAVQHHHAHIASCLADNGRTDRVIGVAYDGTGCGPAGELWGGEILVCDLGSFRRAGHLGPIALAGGEAAIREPWRLAVAARLDAGLPLPDAPHAEQVAQLVLKKRYAPLSTSAGRWFDAVAALCGIAETISYEAQAAMELEAIAAGSAEPYPYTIDDDTIDLRPAVRAIVTAGEPPPAVAGRFHETLARATADFCGRIRDVEAIGTVALSGGCFQNRLLTERLREILESRGFEVLLHHRVPPNDGGLALGQAAVAAWRMTQ